MPSQTPTIPTEMDVEIEPIAGRYLTPVGLAMAEGVSALLPTIRAQAPQAERDGKLSAEVIRGLTDLGIYKAVAPIEHGGFALGARDLAEIAMALGRADASAGWSFFVACSLRMVSSFPAPLVEDLYSRAADHSGPTAAGGSTFAAITGTASRVEGGWQVEGKWTYTSGNHDAAWIFGGVSWHDGERGGHAIVMMDPAGLEHLDDWHVSGMGASDSNSVVTRQPMFVADKHFVDLADLPLHMNSVASRFTGLAYQARARASMLTVATQNIAILVGMAEGAFDVFADLAQKRKPFSPPYPTIAEMPSAQVAAGKAKAKVNAAKAILLQYTDQIDHFATHGGDFSADAEAQGSMDLAFAGNLCQESINLGLQIIGSSAMALSNPLQRFSRDAQVILSHGALRIESLAEITGRRLLGQAPFDMFAAGLQNKAPTPPTPSSHSIRSE
ncbi:acyl-CoA dehydrogenase family protein [Salinibacterium hongtaonis]|uniref:acyl-CoA dehydrogenase family protein n=1 Tax=Homoserinimonas hongtaonis TaxID=2079791 RepID=UPI001304D76D|nr:acyl-CoA dehydrogenase family protein [Salinibacterium hongtaonis]